VLSSNNSVAFDKIYAPRIQAFWDTLEGMGRNAANNIGSSVINPAYYDKEKN